MSDDVRSTLNKALRQLKSQREALDRRIAALEGVITEDVQAARSSARKGPGARQTSKRKRRSGMTAAQKKAVSRRMKKYWAERRKAAAAK